jgi:hypothetical protein
VLLNFSCCFNTGIWTIDPSASKHVQFPTKQDAKQQAKKRISKLSLRVVLADAHKLYYGTEQPVIGHVVVRYEPTSDDIYTANELFGPLKVVLRFYGWAETKIDVYDSGRETWDSFYGGGLLFDQIPRYTQWGKFLWANHLIKITDG